MLPNKMNVIHPNKLLPANLCICGIDSSLYQIGLQLSRIRPNTKRSFIYNPKLISIYVSLYVIQRIVCLFVTDQDLLYMLGDIGAFYGIRIYFNMLLALLQLFVLSNKWFYYCNHKRGIHPTFLRLFQMMSGSLRPIDLELDDSKQVMTLLNMTKKLYPLLKFNCGYLIIPICVAVVLPSYVFHTSLFTTIIYGGIASITYSYGGHLLWCFLGYQYLYFYILCKYFNFKLDNLNKKLWEMKKIKQFEPVHFREILKIIRQFDYVFREIDEYNSTYLSKFLSTLLFVLSGAFVILLYVEIFVSLSLPIRAVLIYASIFFDLILIMTISRAASVNYQAILTYQPINSVYVALATGKYVNLCRLSILFKVFGEFIYYI